MAPRLTTWKFVKINPFLPIMIPDPVAVGSPFPSRTAIITIEEASCASSSKVFSCMIVPCERPTLSLLFAAGKLPCAAGRPLLTAGITRFPLLFIAVELTALFWGDSIADSLCCLGRSILLSPCFLGNSFFSFFLILGNSFFRSTGSICLRELSALFS